MNIFLQIGIGLIPGALFTIFFLVKRKAFAVKKLIMSFLTVAMAGSFMFAGIQPLFIKDNTVNKKDKVVAKAEKVTVSADKMLAMANALYTEGLFEDVEDIINEYSDTYGYDDNCRLIVARIYLAKEQYENAYALYAYLSEKDTELISDKAEEVEFAENRTKYSPADLTLIEYIESVGEDINEYGYSESKKQEIESVLSKDVEDVLSNVYKNLRKQYDLNDNAIESCLVLIRDRDDSKTEEEIKEELSKALKTLEKKESELLNLKVVKKARMEALVINGDFKDIAGAIDEDSTYDELMVVAETYIGGLVKKNDFPDEFHQIDVDEAREVKGVLQEIIREKSENLTGQERDNLKERIEAIDQQIKEPEISNVKELLAEKAETEAGTDKSKVYLELSKVEKYLENDTKSDSYLSDAIYSSQDCTDPAYAYAMGEIIQVIDGDINSTEKIKNVSQYVETVMDNALTADVETYIKTAVEEKKNEESQNGNSYQEEDDENSDNRTYEQSVVDYVSKIRTALNIGTINTSEFEKVVAKVQISSEKHLNDADLKQALKVYDCGAEITEFTLEKLEYACSNIVLVCDVSGSMNYSMPSLRNAVIKFVKEKGPDENLAIVTFNSGIVDTRMFGTSDEDLTAFAQSMRSGGGTNMYSAVQSCMSYFDADLKNNNIIILMTDGEDNYIRSVEEIYSGLGAPAGEKNVTIYTMGLGSSVDTTYLTNISESGGGSFLYVSNDDSLNFFYNTLHEQVGNQYVLTYNALNTMTLSGRTLEVSIPDENLRSSKTYNLPNASEDADGELTITKDKSISGLNPRYIYKGDQDVNILLNGSGFNQDDSISVKLNGIIDYDLTATFQSENNYLVTIPGAAAVGKYDLEVAINGQKVVMKKAFSVLAEGSTQVVKFGKYTFTAGTVIELNDNAIILSDAVTMNGWLNFKGDIMIEGNVESGSEIRVTDNSGSYVNYDKTTAVGVGKFFANHGISMDIPALYTFNLYTDATRVQDIQTGIMKVFNIVSLDSPYINLYPDKINFTYKTGTTILPYQDNIIKKAGGSQLFNFSYDGSASITDKNVGLLLKIDYSDADDDLYNHSVNFFNKPVPFNGGLKFDIDTISNKYTVGASISMPFVAKRSGFGAEISWNNSWIPDYVQLSVKLQKGIMLPTTIPIEMNNFKFKVSDISKSVQNGNWTNLIFTGSLSLSTGKVSTYFPALEKFVGDIAVLEMPDTTASFRINPFMIELDAKLTFLKEITLAKAKLQIGTFDYTNELLGLENAEVAGLSLAVTQGLMWDSADGRVKVEVTGTGKLDAHSRFVGVGLNGTAMMDIKWWLFNFDTKKTGDVALGLYTNEYGRHQFVVIAKYEGLWGSTKGKFYYIDENGKAGENKDFLK